MARKLANWLTAFTEYAQVYNTPDRYRLWGGLWSLATAAKRSIALQVRGTILAPNLFVILVGGPSTGKSQCVSAIKSVLSPATKFKYIPPSVTRAGLEDFMQGNMQTRKAPDGRLLASNECIGLSEEMQGILPDQDLGHLTLYNLLYDLPSRHSAVTRSHGEVNLEAPYCSIFTGAQPAFLASTLPDQAWGMGFMSRSVMVWGTPPPRRSMFASSVINMRLQADLVADLADIHNTHGWFKITPAAEALYNTWWVEHGGVPIPQHKRLAMGYNGRREMLMMKLAMTCSLAESSDLILDEHHVAQAIKIQLETESQTQHIFNEMAQTGSMLGMEDILEVVRNASARDESVPEAVVRQMLMQRVTPSQIHSIIDNLIKGGALVISGGSAVEGARSFKIGKNAGL